MKDKRLARWRHQRGAWSFIVGLTLCCLGRMVRAEATDARPSPSASCLSEVALFDKWMASVPRHENVLAFKPDGFRLADANGTPLDKSRSTVTIMLGAEVSAITPSGMGPVPDLKQLGSLLAKSAKDLATNSPPPVLVLAIDRRRPWSEVVAVSMAASAAGFQQLEFIFERQVRIVPPSSNLDRAREQILRGDPNERLRATAILAQKTFDACAAGLKVFGHAAGSAADDRVDVIATEMPSALRQCNCAVAPKDAMTIAWLAQSPDTDGTIRRSFVGARLRLAKAGQGQPSTVLRTKKDEPWSTASTAVLSAGASANPTTLRLEVSGH